MMERESNEQAIEIDRLGREVEQLKNAKETEEKIRTVESLLRQMQDLLERERREHAASSKLQEQKISGIESQLKLEAKRNLEMMAENEKLKRQLQIKDQDLQAKDRFLKENEDARKQLEEITKKREKEDKEMIQQLQLSLLNLKQEIDKMRQEQQVRHSRVLTPEQIHNHLILQAQHQHHQQQRINNNTKEPSLENIKSSSTSTKSQPIQQEQQQYPPIQPQGQPQSPTATSPPEQKITPIPSRDVKPPPVPQRVSTTPAPNLQSPTRPVRPTPQKSNEDISLGQPSTTTTGTQSNQQTTIPGSSYTPIASTSNLPRRPLPPSAARPRSRTQLPTPPTKAVDGQTTGTGNQTAEDEERFRFEVKLKSTGLKWNK